MAALAVSASAEAPTVITAMSGTTRTLPSPVTVICPSVSAQADDIPASAMKATSKAVVLCMTSSKSIQRPVQASTPKLLQTSTEFSPRERSPSLLQQPLK